MLSSCFCVCVWISYCYAYSDDPLLWSKTEPNPIWMLLCPMITLICVVWRWLANWSSWRETWNALRRRSNLAKGIWWNHFYFLYPLFCLLFCNNLFKSKQALNKITTVTSISNLLHLSSPFSKIVELEEELRVVGNNLKSLEVSEEKVCPLVFPPLLTLQSFQQSLQNLILNLQTVRIFYWHWKSAPPFRFVTGGTQSFAKW